MNTRLETLIKILDDFDEFSINLNQYYDDPEPQSVIDNILSGKIDSLIAFLQILGWSELIHLLENKTPLQGNAVEVLEVIQTVIVPEARRISKTIDIEQQSSPISWFWDLVHPRIKAIAKPRYDAGFFGDAVEASFKEVNHHIKRIVLEKKNKEIDGASLMEYAFSIGNPVIKLNKLETETDKNEQLGFMKIFSGSIIGIRNPQAHGNINPDSKKSLHLISLASLLMHQVDERIND